MWLSPCQIWLVLKLVWAVFKVRGITKFTPVKACLPGMLWVLMLYQVQIGDEDTVALHVLSPLLALPGWELKRLNWVSHVNKDRLYRDNKLPTLSWVWMPNEITYFRFFHGSKSCFLPTHWPWIINLPFVTLWCIITLSIVWPQEYLHYDTHYTGWHDDKW